MSAGRLQTVPYLRLDRNGVLEDTVLIENVAGTFVLLDTPTGFQPSVREFFKSRPGVVMDQRGTYAARIKEEPGGLQVTWIDLVTRQEVAREWEVSRGPLARSDRAAVLDRWAEANSERLTLSPARIRSLLDAALTVPELKPLFTEAVAGEGGSVWLRGFSTTEEVVWSRYSIDDPSPAMVTLPVGDEVVDAGRDWLWVLRRDALDVPRFVKLRVGDSLP